MGDRDVVITDERREGAEPSSEGWRAQFERLAPWYTQFVVNGEGMGGEHSFAEDRRVDLFFEWLGEPESILELSSFEGGHSLRLAARPHVKRLLGLEGRIESIERARLAARALGLKNVEFLQADLDRDELTPYGRFDAVFCAGLLYHLTKPWKLIEEISKVTDRLFLDTHFSDTEEAEIDGYRGSWYREGGYSDPLSGLSSASFWLALPSLERALRGAGFEIHQHVMIDDWDGCGPRIHVAAIKSARQGVGASASALPDSLDAPTSSLAEEWEKTASSGRLPPYVSVGRHTHGHDASTFQVFLKGARIEVGAFCSIAPEVRILAAGEHVSSRVANFPLNARLLHPDDGNAADTEHTGATIVGNDVWIGSGARILSGVIVGDGAVIGASALVSKPVPAYAIAAGNPAEIVGFRFEPDIRRRLQEIGWWHWSDEEIRELEPWFMGDLAAFLEIAEQRHRPAPESDYARLLGQMSAEQLTPLRGARPLVGEEGDGSAAASSERVAELERELTAMRGTLAWRMAVRYWRIRERLRAGG